MTWRRAQMVLLLAQGMDAAGIAKVAFTSEDRLRDVIRNFSADGFGSLCPRYKGGRPPRFTLPQRSVLRWNHAEATDRAFNDLRARLERQARARDDAYIVWLRLLCDTVAPLGL